MRTGRGSMDHSGGTHLTVDQDSNPHSKPQESRNKKLATTVYITEEQQALLKELNRRTRVPIAEFIREGIDLVLEQHAAQLPGQMGLIGISRAEPTSSFETRVVRNSAKR